MPVQDPLREMMEEVLDRGDEVLREAPDVIWQRSQQAVSKQSFHPPYPILVSRLVVRTRNRSQKIVINRGRLFCGVDTQSAGEKMLALHFFRLTSAKVTDLTTR